MTTDEFTNSLPAKEDKKPANKDIQDGKSPFIIKRAFEINGNHYEIGITDIEKVNTKCIKCRHIIQIILSEMNMLKHIILVYGQ